ncbi:MAG: LysR family transcriptional regulator [Bradyrhizobiaceae bacterium]|nr:LysR family transcriptional regulator [Bradyrhizobiaceae bacterium]
MRFDLTDLRLFLHVAEARSITHGAERAGLALASASARVRGMEEALGTALLIRDRHGVALSPAGECLVEHARGIVQAVERMRGELGAYAGGLAGSVRLLSNTAALSEHLPGALAGFLVANPAISVEVEERESVDIGAALAAGAADIGIASAVAVTGAVEQFPFRDDRLVVVLPRGDDLGRKRRLSLAAIVNRAFVGLSRGSALQRHLAGHAARIGATLKVRVRVGGFDAICALVEAGAGIGIVPETSAARCRRSMKINVVKLEESWALRRLAICVRDLRTLPPGAQRLVAHLRRSCG